MQNLIASQLSQSYQCHIINKYIKTLQNHNFHNSTTSLYCSSYAIYFAVLTINEPRKKETRSKWPALFIYISCIGYVINFWVCRTTPHAGIPVRCRNLGVQRGFWGLRPCRRSGCDWGRSARHALREVLASMGRVTRPFTWGVARGILGTSAPNGWIL